MSHSNRSSLNLDLTSFLFGSFVTALIGLAYSTSRASSTDVSRTKKNHDELSNRSLVKRSLTAEIRSEQLSRNYLYFGSEGLESIIESSIVVVGLGGVGSHAAHMLARAGVGYLRLIDFDQVTLSSLNRHACATLEDVGTPKVFAIKRYLERICPDSRYLEIDARVQMYTGDSDKDRDLLEFPEHRRRDGCPNHWNYVVDAIDDVPTKAMLLAYCLRNKIRVISCMGAGGKSDMTRLHISDLRSASRDPLASKLRQTLKRNLAGDTRVGDHFLDDIDQLAVVYSSEKTVVKLADFTEQQLSEGVHKFGAVDNMRIRILPVLGTMPAIMGQSLAAMVLCELGKKPFSPLSGERVGRNVRHRLHQHFKNREHAIRTRVESKSSLKLNVDNLSDNREESDWMEPLVVNGVWIGPVQIDVDDVEYILTEVWRNRCAVSGESLGTVLDIVRWDLSKASNCRNLVIMGSKARQKFDNMASECGDGRNSVSLEIRQRIEARLESCKIDSRY